MSRVIAAVDDTPAAAAVLATAVAIAPLVTADVEALHVSENDEAAPRTLAEGFGVPFQVARGDVAAVLIDLAGNTDDVAAIVVGVSARRHGVPFVGHVAQHVLTHARVPVVAVPPGASVPLEVRRVLVPLDGTAPTTAALRAVLEMARHHHLDVTVLHVYEESAAPLFSDQPAHEARAWTTEFLRRHCPDSGAVSLEVRIGTVATHVVDVAVETRADLVALGWSQDLTPGRARVVRHAVETSPVPVLLVPVVQPVDAGQSPQLSVLHG